MPIRCCIDPRVTRLFCPFVGLGQLAQKSATVKNHTAQSSVSAVLQVILRGFLALSVAMAGTFVRPAFAQPTPAGTVITNTANSAQVEATIPLASVSNVVRLTVGAGPGTPTLSKAFSVATIADGGATNIVFTIANVAGNPAQAGIGFVDTLPARLRLQPTSVATISGAGCAGTSTLTLPQTISISTITMGSGTAVCTVTVTAVTNATGQTNPSCVSSPVAFTNGSANISALLNLASSVTNQCLTVVPIGVPTLTKSFALAEIEPAGSTQLRFTITNSAGNPAQSGIAFTDTLPASLRLTTVATATVTGAGCTATILLTAPGTIAVTNLTMALGTTSCTVTVTSVTNVANQLNTACGTNPAAFTNSSASISGAANVTNAVTNQCLLVKLPPPPPAPVVDPPVLTKAFQSPFIVAGDWTELTFTIDPKTTPLGGLGFQDLLPTGLAFRVPAQVTMEGGCTGLVTFSTTMPPQPNIISFSQIWIPKGATVCTIRVEGVTNRVGRTNPTGCGAANDADFTNSAANVIDTGDLVNNIAPQCLRVLPALPSLTKQFGADRIYDKETTSLTFTVRNSVGYPQVSNVAFVDTLPSGLRFATGATAQIQGAGCTGSVQINGESSVSVSRLNMAAGTAVCRIAVSGVSNSLDRLNPSCAGSPAAFTNAASSISGAANLHNLVQPACLVVDPLSPALDLAIRKSISAFEGYSPSGTYTVSLSVVNSFTTLDARKRNVSISDTLPQGMLLVPGSVRVGIGGTSFAVEGSSGSQLISGRIATVTSSSSQVDVNLASLEPGETATVTFSVTIAPNLAKDLLLSNTGQLAFTNSANRDLNRASNTVTFRVLGALGVTVTGQTIASAEPGEDVIFRNVITNRGNVSDTYDITLGGSTFPAGSVVRLLDSDGVAMLPDTSGNGVPDTGVLEPGASKIVIVRVTLPIGQKEAGPFRVTKSARSVRSRPIGDADDDVLLTVNRSCKVLLEADNRGRVRSGASLTYFHVMTNIGNCTETVSGGSVTSGATGWAARAVINIASAPGGAIAGLVSASNPPAAQTVQLAPGESVGYLVEVTAPQTAKSGDVSTSVLSLSSVGRVVKSDAAKPKDAVDTARTLSNQDVTTVDANAVNTPDDVIRPFVDGDFRRPSLFGFIGRTLFIRANAASCNALPDVIERRTIIITGPNGEREEIIAIETGPNTGIFDASIPVKLPPVAAGSGFLEGNAYDSFLIEIVGCGRRIVTSVTLIDPNGVVFDSRTNEPVSGAIVRIVNAAAGVCSNTLSTVQALNNGQVVPARNPVTTGADGKFDFPLVSPGDFCVQVKPPNGYTWTSVVPSDQLPRSRNVLVTGPTSGGSYGSAFRVGPETGPVLLDIPVDPGRIDGLFIRKDVLRPIVELGEFADYVVTLSNQTGFDLNKSEVFADDSLPAGFAYIAGSTKVDGKPIRDPEGGAGPRLRFRIGYIKAAEKVKLTYRVRVGAGALQGDGINRVVASYRLAAQGQYSESNVATAKVTVSEGIFSNRAYVVGKIFADCNKDGLQTAHGDSTIGEVGVPAVRLLLEDGTSAVTDAEGKFSFYGVLARTHVLKIDRTTLPEGVRVEHFGILSNRNLGKGDSRVLDLKNGELHKANFSIRVCTPEAVADIEKRRRTASSLATEVDGRLQQKLATDTIVRPLGDLKALPAAGLVGQPVVPTNASGTPAISQSGAALSTAGGSEVRPSVLSATTNSFQPLAASTAKALPPNQSVPPLPSGATAKAELPLEDVLAQEDNTLGFMGLRDGAVLPYAQTAVRVKGTAGATFRLTVNGQLIDESKVGKKASLQEKVLQAWEYIGVNLLAGANELVVTQFDAFGGARGEAKITVKAPGELAKIEIDFSDKVKAQGGGVADGRTPVKVVVRLKDKFGTPVTTRLPVTLSSSIGRWDVNDLNTTDPGTQVFVEGGSAEYLLMPPNDPGQARIGVESGRVKADVPLDFLPDLREMVAAGVIEGVLNLRKLDSRALAPTREQDSFEREISHLSRRGIDGKADSAVRAALFLKGKVKGEYLLTMAYDSDKDTKERLFRDIQPDEFYPVYGDSAIRAFDAQSTGRFYLRVDHKKSYLLYGDYNTSASLENRQLTNYNRSLTGVKQHYESKAISANVFASRDSTKQVIDEFPANGTSGPFTLTAIKGLINSEKIEVLTRDRSRTNIVLRAVPLARFVDYEIEPLTGRILLKAPVASLDENLNPQSLRITYEVDQGGAQFWVAGGDVQVKLNDRVELGAMMVDDRNPTDKFRMVGINAVTKLADKSFLIAEIARTSREKFALGDSLGDVSGSARRIQLKHADGKLEGDIFLAKADGGFDNPSASIAKGRTEAGGKMSYRLDDKTRLTGELLASSDNVSGAKRDGIMLNVERTLATGLRVEAGVRHARDTQVAPLPGNAGIAGIAPQQEVTTVRTKLTGEIPWVKGLSAYGEAEVDVQDSKRKILAIGGDYHMANKGRLYLRHEFASSITGPYGLSNQQRQNATVVGLNTDYMKDGNVFSEYRVRDAISGGDAEAALGLRNMWTLADGLKLQTGFERVHTLAGKGQGESTAATFGLEYTANALWKGSTRLELREGANQDSILSTVALASKLGRDWTFLGRNTFSLIKNKGQTSGENKQDRLQLGVAYRDTDTDKWNGLARVERRVENDTTQADIVLKRTVEMVSLHANWQPIKPFTFSGRYAAKRVNENSNGLASKTNAQLVGARAIWEVAPRWDVSLNASTMFSNGSKAKQYGLGVELGFMVMENLWLSAGYNWFGYKDADLMASEYTNKGVFVRMRFKFDEDLFATKSKSAVTTTATDLPVATRASEPRANVAQGSGATTD